MNKYLEIRKLIDLERKNQMWLWPEMKPVEKQRTKKPTKKKATARGEPVDFDGQPRRCEMWGCSSPATMFITGPNKEIHYYCDEHWEMSRIHEKTETTNMAETPFAIRAPDNSESAPI